MGSRILLFLHVVNSAAAIYFTQKDFTILLPKIWNRDLPITTFRTVLEYGENSDDFTYRLASHRDVFSLNPKLGELSFIASHQLFDTYSSLTMAGSEIYTVASYDREKLSLVHFQISCSYIHSNGQYLNFTIKSQLNILDEDDNPPCFQHSNITDRIVTLSGVIDKNNPHQSVYFHTPLVIYDLDLKKNNHFAILLKGEFRIRHDIFEFNGKTFLGINLWPNQFTAQEEIFHLWIDVVDESLIGSELNTYVVSNDTRTGYSALSSKKDIYINHSIPIYSRLQRIPPLSENTKNAFFSLVSSKHSSAFNITHKEGILYVSNPELLLRSAKHELRILRRNDNAEDFTTVVVHVMDHASANNCSDVCSKHAEQSTCEKSCGIGSKTGNCHWKPSKEDYGLLLNYATCSQDVDTCPDGSCDELEQLNGWICPQDCVASEPLGIAVRKNSKTGLGIWEAYGVCHCSAPNYCSCLPTLESGNTSERKMNFQKESLFVCNQECFLGIFFFVLICLLGCLLIAKRRFMNHLRSWNPTGWRDNSNLSKDELQQLLKYAVEIASGMAYLASMKLVHRDLATRNVLLTSSNECKISDFGMMRDVYEEELYMKKSKGRVPVKWMALESLTNQIYTTKSDSWSFGIVLWEIFTFGSTPYPATTPERMLKLLQEGYRMEKPLACPDEIYQIMLGCWETYPDQRPHFSFLKDFFQLYLSKLDEESTLNVLPSAHNLMYSCM